MNVQAIGSCILPYAALAVVCFLGVVFAGAWILGRYIDAIAGRPEP